MFQIAKEEAEKLVTICKLLAGRLVTPNMVAAAYDAGMIRKTDLIDGEVYYGDHRIAEFAMWSAFRQEFVYARYKFGQTFPDHAKHPEDDDGYSLFIPIWCLKTKIMEEGLMPQ